LQKGVFVPTITPLASIKCQLAIVQIDKKKIYVLKGFLFFLKYIGVKSVI